MDHNNPRPKTTTRKSHPTLASGAVQYLSCSLHTFCLGRKCMLPMCSTCISLHNEQHREENSHGRYKSIQQVAQEAAADIKICLRQLQDANERYLQDYQRKDIMIQSCRKEIQDLKTKVQERVQRLFDEIEVEMERQIAEFTEQIQEMYMKLDNKVQDRYYQLTQDQSILLYQQHEDPKSNPTARNHIASIGSPLNNQHKFLKKLIQYYSRDQNSSNSAEIARINTQLDKIKKMNQFSLTIDKSSIKRIVDSIKNKIRVNIGAVVQQLAESAQLNHESSQDPKEESSIANHSGLKGIKDTKIHNFGFDVLGSKKPQVTPPTHSKRPSQSKQKTQQKIQIPYNNPFIDKINEETTRQQTLTKNNQNSSVSIVTNLSNIHPPYKRYISPQPFETTRPNFPSPNNAHRNINFNGVNRSSRFHNFVSPPRPF